MGRWQAAPGDEKIPINPTEPPDPHFPGSDRIARIQIAIDSFYENKEYIKNEHAWYFTPDSFLSIMNDLIALELVDMEVERMFPTLKNSGEFWVILRSKPVAN